MPWWESNIFWGIAGIVGGALVSAIYQCIGKERYTMKHRKTIKKITPKEATDIPEAKAFFKNQSIKELFMTTIKFTNCGNKTIGPSDYAAQEPLGIQIFGQLCKCNVSAENHNSMPKLRPWNGNKYKIDFDFLKPRQSFSIKLLHSGYVKVFGELRSGKSIAATAKLYSKNMMIVEAPLSPVFSIVRLLLSTGAVIAAVYFLFTVKPLLFTIIGIICGAAASNLLFFIKERIDLHNTDTQKYDD